MDVKAIKEKPPNDQSCQAEKKTDMLYKSLYTLTS